MKELVFKTPYRQLDKVGRPDIYLKLECNQFANSFKTRGIVNYLDKANCKSGLVTFTTGNHGISLAAIAKHIGLPAFIFSTKDLSIYKRQIIESHGAKVQLLDLYDLDQSTQYVLEFAKAKGLTFVPLFGNYDLLDGYSEITKEICEDFKESFEVFLPIGSGSLLLANAKVAKSINTKNKVIGVEPEAFQRVNQEKPNDSPSKSVADSLSLNKIPFCNAELFKYVDKFIAITEKEIINAMDLVYKEFGIMTEAGGAIALSAAIATPVSEQIKFAVITGKNISQEKFLSLMAQTKFTSETAH